MLKILLKKQLYELNRGFFYDQRTGKCRSKTASIAFIGLYILLMLFVSCALFAVMAVALCRPLHEQALDWLYFALFGLLSVTMGVFGSVFNTFASLYQAKDNNLLLSLPVPVRDVLIVRLSGVYLMGVMFSALVFLPGMVVYNIMVRCSVATIVGPILMFLAISVLVLVLSCGLGWIVAKISAHLKRKSLISVIASLAFVGIYYYIYFNAYQLVGGFLENAAAVGSALSRGAGYPIYLFGRMGLGEPVATLIILAVMAALFAFVWWLLSHSFFKLATAPGVVDKKVYREKTVHGRSQSRALLSREAQRITSSATCMLNCYFGTLMLLLGAVAIAIKGRDIVSLFIENYAPVLGSADSLMVLVVSALICFMAGMNCGTASAISLEGKSLWVVKSMPVTAWDVIRAKLRLFLIATSLPALICSVCGAVVTWNGDIVTTVATVLMPQMTILMVGELGLVINLKRPNFNWTNEVAVVKQGLGVFVMIMGSMVFSIIYGVGCVLFYNYAAIFTVAITLVMGIAALLLHRWLRLRGSRIFAEL